ncbi:MAG TPA: FtsX-like permease family protein [Tepidisphaeraceae bacterium]|jgi:ABC-type lipoprotein release transport system permease subunit|nr:FtsX-like permease family protein [Tepidisphaeraceae bacterium]
MSVKANYPGAVRKQIKLPMSKAIEIAYKSIRLRLSRSLLVISAIVLALAFLMSILTTQNVVIGMRQWIAAANQTPAQHGQLLAAQQLEARMKAKGIPMSAEEIQNDRIQTRWLVGLALLVAFVGILNAMLMSVTERFREIGTMKCLGALDGFIVRLFLLESLFQGVVGTTIGVIAGVVVSLAGASLSYGADAWRNFPAATVILAAAGCLTIGIVLTVAGAIYPAWTAARMQPIEAMRVET